MDSIFPYIHRDISWLHFNYRVLQEAKDKTVPLLERVKFLAIFSSNLDEFFRVRVANHRNLVRAGKSATANLDFEPKEVLEQILKLVNKYQEEFTDIYENQIVPELSKHKIRILKVKDLDKKQKQYVDNYFHDTLQPYLQPIVLLGKKVKPFLNNNAIYLALELKDKVEQYDKNLIALLKIPSQSTKRFIIIPSSDRQSNELILLDDVVRYCAHLVFPGFHIKGMYSIKITRDAELYIDDEFSGDLLAKVRKSLKKRNVGVASRLVYDRETPSALLKRMVKVFDLHDYDLSPEGHQHNNSDFFGFPSFNQDNLKEKKLPPLPYKKLEQLKSVFDGIRSKDHLLFYPFESYESVIRFFEDAADDPDVTHISIIQYRVASKSRIMDALMKAVKKGKKVFAFVEIKARFDEEANLEWGAKMEAAGIKVQYSMPGFKVHSKIALVRKIENGEAQFYGYFSTGNFNESTATLYSDIGLFTSDTRLTKDAYRFFKFLEKQVKPKKEFKHLAIGQFNLNKKLDALIDQEIKNAKAGKKAKMIIKLNSLQDKKIIKKLYEASQAGVKIKLIIRGICSLVAGVRGFSDNIEVISIVDRFLEHARIYSFYNGGEPLYFIASADWMRRNLYYRYETMVPVYDKNAKKILKDVIDLQLSDNVKARKVGYNITNEYKSDDKYQKIRSQIETYHYFERLSIEEEWM